MGPLIFSSNSLDDTFALAEAFSRVLQRESIVFLSGDLGAGKTAFVQGIARALGSVTPATSPTFNLMQEYKVSRVGEANEKNVDGVLAPFDTVFHFDLYRVEDENELGETGLLDVAGSEGPTFIEWGEPFQGFLGQDYFRIKIDRVANDKNDEKTAKATIGDTDGRAEKASNADTLQRTFAFLARGREEKNLEAFAEFFACNTSAKRKNSAQEAQKL